MNYKTRQPFPHAAYVEGQRNFTYFDRSLTSGLTDVVIESPGDFLYIDQASTGVVSVELNMRQGGTLAPILLAAGGSIECDFASIKLTASAQLNKSVRIIVGNGAKIKGGANVNASSMSVSVVDGGLVTTEANQAFMRAALPSSPAGNFAHAQLWNPSASGKVLLLKKMLLAAPSVPQYIYGGSHNVELTTDVGNGFSKLIGGANGVGNVNTQSNAAALVTNQFFATYLDAGVPFQFTFAEPVEIPAGYGFNLYPGSYNTTIGVTFEWLEK